MPSDADMVAPAPPLVIPAARCSVLESEHIKQPAAKVDAADVLGIKGLRGDVSAAKPAEPVCNSACLWADVDLSACGDGAPQAACIVTVLRGRREEHLLCVLCGDSSAALLQASGALSAKLLHGSGCGKDAMHDIDCPDEGADPSLCGTMESIGPPWSTNHILLRTIGCGPHAGLRAVGVGSNLKKRRRAANLAIAATAALHSACPCEGVADVAFAEFQELVGSVRRALRQFCPPSV